MIAKTKLNTKVTLVNNIYNNNKRPYMIQQVYLEKSSHAQRGGGFKSAFIFRINHRETFIHLFVWLF